MTSGSTRPIVIFQVERYLLRLHISILSARLRGLGLDLGVGPVKRYEDLLIGREIVSVDLNPAFRPDVVADMRALPFRSESMDFVLCTQVLGDVEEPLEPLLEVQRVLKPGGQLLLSESLMCELHDEPFDYWRFTKYGLKSLCEKAGLRVKIILQRGGFYSTLFQFFTRYVINKLNLYSRLSLAHLINKVLRVGGFLSLKLDHADQSPLRRKYSLGWSLLAQKRK